MKKSLKIVAILLMTILMVATCAQFTYAANDKLSGLVDNIGEASKNNNNTEAAGDLTIIAGKVLSLIQIASAVAAVVLVAVFGFKFIMGSAQEKADYQKSFIPLIVGVVVVFSATSIAKLLFSLIGN